MSLNMLRTVGNQLDYCLVMSYDAGNLTTTGYNPKVGRGGWGGGGGEGCVHLCLSHTLAGARVMLQAKHE